MSRAASSLPPIDLGDAGIDPDDVDLPGEEETPAPGTNPGLQTVLEQHNVALSLLADPDVQAVLQAKREGRTLQVAAPGQAAPANEEVEEPADLEGMNNAQLVQHMTGQFEKVLGAVVGKQLAPLQERLSQLDQVASETVQDRTRREIESVQEKHPDFKDYGKEIMGLHEQHPTLKVKDLYLLAKSQKLASMPQEATRPGTRSERPAASIRPAGKPAPSNQNSNLTGRAGMRAILADHFRRNPRT